ncbi:hypothetical protein T4D_10226, partial [Trichinella pseudospiralis]
LIFILKNHKVTYPMTKRAKLLSYCSGSVFKLIQALISPANINGEHFSLQRSEIVKRSAFYINEIRMSANLFLIFCRTPSVGPRLHFLRIRDYVT